MTHWNLCPPFHRQTVYIFWIMKLNAKGWWHELTRGKSLTPLEPYKHTLAAVTECIVQFVHRCTLCCCSHTYISAHLLIQKHILSPTFCSRSLRISFAFSLHFVSPTLKLSSDTFSFKHTFILSLSYTRFYFLWLCLSHIRAQNQAMLREWAGSFPVWPGDPAWLIGEAVGQQKWVEE